MAVSLPVSEVGQTHSPTQRASDAVWLAPTPVPSSLPSLLTWDWGLSPVSVTRSHKQVFDPISVTPKMAAGCAVVLSAFLTMLRMWMKKSWWLAKSSHRDILRGPCWPLQGWSSPSHQAEGPQCPAMLLRWMGRAGPAVIPVPFPERCPPHSPTPAERGFGLRIFPPCQQRSDLYFFFHFG